LAERVLKTIAEQNLRVISAGQIQRVVAEYFSLRTSELKAKNNSRRVVHPRQIAMYLCREMTDDSLPQIGRAFGGKHHATVIHSVRKIKELRSKDLRVNQTINQLIDKIH
jgi:chromosomal replication initiator protein